MNVGLDAPHREVAEDHSGHSETTTLAGVEAKQTTTEEEEENEESRKGQQDSERNEIRTGAALR